ncbi:MAG: glycosyltransferase [Methanoregulaceae archaeon]|jgi:glycosyltransferase involved in cell wall biosynthesis|nr:glycosyltransferase [Methanoregulaceae archaeon]
MPLISALMPSYNHAAYIGEAIASVLSQSVRDIELIIIDDASTDGSARIIDDWRRKDERITVVIHQVNQGIARTINEGCRIAKGKYIAFIASDDVWIPDKLEKQLQVLRGDENLIVWSEGLIIEENGSLTGETFSRYHHAENKKKTGNIFDELLTGNFIFGSSMIFKRENIATIQFNEDLKYLNDFQFNVDLANLYHYAYIEEPLAQYRIHRRNTIAADFEGHYHDYPILGGYFLERYGDVIKNSIKVKIFLASVEHVKKIVSIREEKIGVIKEYAESLEKAMQRRDVEVADLTGQMITITEHAKSLENTIHQKDAEIDNVTSYSRSLEEAVHLKDAEIDNVTSYSRSLEEALHVKDAELSTITSYARSLEDAVHQRDYTIGELNIQIQRLTEYSLSLENQMSAMKRSIFIWLKMRKQA